MDLDELVATIEQELARQGSQPGPEPVDVEALANAIFAAVIEEEDESEVPE